MTRYRKVQHQVPADGLLFLKPEKLGRYYHKVPVYIKKLAGKYPRAISDYFLSRRRQKLSATPDLSGTVLPLCLIPNSALKSAPPFKSVMPKAS
ncbi:hypothetical protein HBN88_11785, partial [Pseudomonas fragi]|nr:hypothetical protein [Pseudomonas fragi]